MAVDVDLDFPLAEVPLVPQAYDLQILDFPLQMRSVRDRDVFTEEYTVYLEGLLGIIPVPIRSLNLHAPSWPDGILAQTMPRLASPTLQSLYFMSRLPPGVTDFDFDETLLDWAFRLSTHKLDVQFPALVSLTAPLCMPPAAYRTPWGLPSSLRKLDLSESILTARDAGTICPLLPSGLRELHLYANQIDSLPASFPPMLRVPSVDYNNRLDNSNHWIEALPSSLREISVAGCDLDNDAGTHLLEMRRHAGSSPATGEAKLTIDFGSMGNRFSERVRIALAVEPL
ncbi:hypothetical protein GGF32_003533 [Allomyces javanicus]|nr:hypothetical protein GGF32_003533 [Allomyces javanicus]